MPMSDYFNVKALNQSLLKGLERSPLHTKTKKHETKEMAFGSAFHCFMLTPSLFKSEYEVVESLDLRKKKDKDLLKTSSKKLLTESDMSRIYQMGGNISKKTDLIQKMNCSELSVFWQDFDILCKARIDSLVFPCDENKGIIVDLKTTSDASPNVFIKQIFRMKYHWQSAWYQTGIKCTMGHKFRFIIIACESEPPFDCAIYEISQDAIESAKMEYEHLIDVYRNCIKTDEYKGYSSDIILVENKRRKI